MRFGLVANLKREGAGAAVQTFIEWSQSAKHLLVLSNKLKDDIGGNQTYVDQNKLADSCDVLVSMGGDGTLLSSARAVGDKGTPLLGINIGSLGFLTQITPKQMIPCFERIVKGEYEIEKRMALEAHVDGESSNGYALNDVVVDNGPVSRMIDLSLRVNNEDIVTYRCDGLIIATPTGSTAYSLAVGGPIMHPTTEAIIASPISAFSLSTRPMIFRPIDELKIGVRSAHGAAALTLDGQVMKELSDGDTVVIRRAGFSHKFIVFPESSFYSVCRTKLHWGMSPLSESE